MFQVGDKVQLWTMGVTINPRKHKHNVGVGYVTKIRKRKTYLRQKDGKYILTEIDFLTVRIGKTKWVWPELAAVLIKRRVKPGLTD